MSEDIGNTFCSADAKRSMIGDGPITWLRQIQSRYSMRSKVDIVNSVYSRGSQSHMVTEKGFADVKLAPTKRDLSVRLYLAQLVCRSVLDRRQLLGKRSRARLIATGRHLHVQSFMRSHVIVAVAPLLKSTLHVPKVAEHSLGQHFNFQSAMKALLFALRLRMIRAAVSDGDAEPQEPNRQWRELMLEVVTPGRTIIHQHPLWQSITPKSGRQSMLYGGGLLIRAGLETKRITRMIIEHSQRMTALVIAQTKVSFEVHLPELVRSLLLEPLISTDSIFRCIRHATMAQKNRVHSALSQRPIASSLQTRLDLACPPAVPIADRQHLFFDYRLAARRRMLRSARKIRQAGDAFFSIPPPPFVTGLAANAEPLAQLTKTNSWLLSQGQKLLSQSHGRTLLPRHDTPPKKVFMLLCNVLPMSSDTCYLCLRYIHKQGGEFSGSYLYFPMIASSFLKVSSGHRSGAVKIAFLIASRYWFGVSFAATRCTASFKISCALRTFLFKYSITMSTVTSSWPSCQQS